MYYSPILFSRVADLNLIPVFLNLKRRRGKQYIQEQVNLLNKKDNIIIFCIHSPVWLRKLLPFLNEIEKPFILITAMEDMQLPSEVDLEFIEYLKHHEYFKHWFAINKTIPNDAMFTSIPYGLDYWTLTKFACFHEPIQTYEQQNSCLESIANKALHFSQRIPKIYANFHLNLTDKRHMGLRLQLLDIIPKDIIDYQSTRLPRSETFQNMSNYSFVVSPFGHGFDTIRTFEALCLGCIVVMKRCFLDIVYQDLPVLFVDEWTDINQELLDKTLVSFASKQFNYQKLKMDYWIDLVKSKF